MSDPDRQTVEAALNARYHTLGNCSVNNGSCPSGATCSQIGQATSCTCPNGYMADGTCTPSWIAQGAHLVSYWPMDKSWADVVGINTGNTHGQAGIGFTSTAKFGSGAAILGGPGNPGAMYVDNPVSIPSTGYTLAAWIYPLAANSGGIIGYGTYGTSYAAHGFRLSGADNEIVDYWWAASDLTVQTGFSLLNAWHFMVSTYDPGSGIKAIYVDGTLIGTLSAPVPGFTMENFAVGKTCCSEYFTGTIDDVMIWNTALSGAEIQAMYGAVGSACPVSSPPNCDDGNPCTADSCNPLSGCVHAAMTGSDQVMSETFDGITGGGSGSQCSTGGLIYYGKDLPGWTKSGTNALHALDRGAGNSALQFYDTNSVVMNTGVAANTSGQAYVVQFTGGPTVWNSCAQASDANSGLIFELLRADNTVVATHTWLPGAWTGSQPLNPQSFTYTGDGTGNVRLRIRDNLNDGLFGGTVDDLGIFATCSGP